MRSVWEAESLPQWHDFILVIVSAFTYPLLRSILDMVVYERLAKRAVLRKEGGNWKKVVKFTESSWKVTYYFAAVVIAILISYREPWFFDTRAFWPGWPYQTMKFQLKLYYTLQCGFYVYGVVALMLWDTRRKDFIVMLSHHAITICLIGYSYITGAFRVGSIVLAIHDVSDVLLETAKLFKYSQRELGAGVFFALFALSWLTLRLIFYPFWIIKSTTYEVIEFVDKSNYLHGVQYFTFNTLLITLLVMHFYWWILISRMISKQIQLRGQIPEDVRSDSDDD